jgi:hypothetical protein
MVLKQKRTVTAAVGMLLVLCCVSGALGQNSKRSTPRVFLMDTHRLARIKLQLANHPSAPNPAVAKLEKEAQLALSAGPFSVVDKQVTPPSGDKHDYMSQAPYFWPDPSKPNGLPYIRRDGERNPEIEKLQDHRAMDEMVSSVSTLALAYYLKGNRAYAEKATQLLRVWFVNSETRMNPNLQFGQAIPGINTGRGIGLIETRGLTEVVDAIGLLSGAKAWTKADQKAVELWFAEFLRWMQQHKYGLDEAAALNNHGTYYDLQVASFALLLGNKQLAREILETSKLKRIARQIEPDGYQPLEIARTRSWGYSLYNLDGLTQLAVLGERVGVDLWRFETEDGRSIRRAIDALFPYAIGDAKWPHAQITEFMPQSLFPILRRAASTYDDQKFKAMLARLPNESPDVRQVLSGY